MIYAILEYHEQNGEIAAAIFQLLYEEELSKLLDDSDVTSMKISIKVWILKDGKVCTNQERQFTRHFYARIGQTVIVLN